MQGPLYAIGCRAPSIFAQVLYLQELPRAWLCMYALHAPMRPTCNVRPTHTGHRVRSQDQQYQGLCRKHTCACAKHASPCTKCDHSCA